MEVQIYVDIKSIGMNIMKKILKRNRVNKPNYYDMCIFKDKDLDIRMQDIENKHIERLIKLEAARWFDDYKNSETITIDGEEYRLDGIKIMNPFMFTIKIYDEDTAKYKNANIRELVRIEYDKLIDEFNKEENNE